MEGRERVPTQLLLHVYFQKYILKSVNALRIHILLEFKLVLYLMLCQYTDTVWESFFSAEHSIAF